MSNKEFARWLKVSRDLFNARKSVNAYAKVMNVEELSKACELIDEAIAEVDEYLKPDKEELSAWIAEAMGV